jgi:hypothetical protein
MSEFQKRIDVVDFHHVREELIRFLENQDELKYITQDTLNQMIDKLKD